MKRKEVRSGGQALGEGQRLCLMLESLKEEKNTTVPRKSLDANFYYLNWYRKEERCVV